MLIDSFLQTTFYDICIYCDLDAYLEKSFLDCLGKSRTKKIIAELQTFAFTVRVKNQLYQQIVNPKF